MSDDDWFQWIWKGLSSELLARFRAFFRQRTVLLIGAGGVGKSTIGRFLRDGMSALNLNPGYEESFDAEIEAVQHGRIKAQFLILPGQRHRRPSTWQEPLESVQNGEISDVIVVNSFGYHSIGPLGLRGEGLYQKLEKNGQQDRFLDEYLKLKQSEEIEVLKFVSPYLKGRRKGPLRMMTVVTKEDLWFDQRTAVADHYCQKRRGSYDSVVEEIREALGDVSFRYEFVGMSLLIQNFIGNKDEPLRIVSNGYNQDIQNESAKSFLRALEAFCQEL